MYNGQLRNDIIVRKGDNIDKNSYHFQSNSTVDCLPIDAYPFGPLDILLDLCYTIDKQSKGGRQMSALQKKTEYILMNKDCRVLSFLCIRNEYDEPTFQELQWFVEYRPIGYKSLTGFLERRKAPKHREHIQRLLERFGCDDLEGFLNVTHAVSLNDTFWVKRADRDISWDQVSLYGYETA